MLKKLYYILKYRSKKVSDGPTAVSLGVIAGKGMTKTLFDEKVNNLSKSISPCYKSNAEVLSYLKGKYTLTEKILSDSEKENYKINFLLGKRPELLSTPELRFKGKMPKRKELLKFQEQNEKRFSEARNYPIEKLGLDIEAYTFEYVLEDGFKVVFKVIAENKYDTISALFSVINRNLSAEEELQLRCITDDITVYKGVKKEDIENKTPDFVRFVAAWKGGEELN